MSLKACMILALSGALAHLAPAATTINSVNKFAYGANIGWMDWRGNGSNGAVIGQWVCSGNIWAANVGWINIGSGIPANGIRYQNNVGSDFGVNHDGAGNLTGNAWGANIGWITFTNRDGTGETYEGPKVDLLTGRLSGFAWSANCGWISLSNDVAFVKTDSMDYGVDTDNDGLPDAWEFQYGLGLSVLQGSRDYDHDGLTDLGEFIADTNPRDTNSNLRITEIEHYDDASPTRLTWTSRPTRLYRIRGSGSVADPQPWPDAGLGLFAPDPETSTTRTVGALAAPFQFFVIEAVTPLSP